MTALEAGTTVVYDGLRWMLVGRCPTVGVWRLSLLDECDPYPVGQVGFAHEDQMVVARLERRG